MSAPGKRAAPDASAPSGPTEPRPGLAISANLELKSLLGEGGMGSVWIAHNTMLDTEVAVKFMAPSLMGASSVAKRFLHEARTAAKIKSPHVVQTFEYGFLHEAMPYIVMEKLEGEPLDARLHRDGPLSPRELELLMVQVADVLTLAHDLGIVHRDIKPQNLFLVRSSHDLFVKVLDFGIAKQTRLEASPLTETGAMIGTPSYMSPELVQSAKDATLHADLWALAVALYESMTGRLPFVGETLGAVLLRISTSDFPSPSTLVPGAPASIDAFFQRALHQDPAQRFPTANAMKESFSISIQEMAGIGRAAKPGSGASNPSPAALLKTTPIPQESSGVAHVQAPAAHPAEPRPPLASATVSWTPNEASTAPAASSPLVALPGATLSPTTETPAGMESSGRLRVIVVAAVLFAATGIAAAVALYYFRGKSEVSSERPAAGAEAAPEASASDERSNSDSSVPPDVTPLASSDDASPAPSTSTSASAESPTASHAPMAPKLPSPPPASTPAAKPAAPPPQTPAIDCSGDSALIVVGDKVVVRPECR